MRRPSLRTGWTRRAAAIVERAISDEGALLTSVNLAEVLAKLDDLQAGLAASFVSVPPRAVVEAALTPTGGATRPGAIALEPFTSGDAVVSATLGATTKAHGLSLGDRACLAVAKRLGLDAVTADRSWTAVSSAVGVSIRLIR